MRTLLPDIRNFNVLFDSAVPWDHERMTGSNLPVPVDPDHIRTSGYMSCSTVADGQYRMAIQATPSVLTRLTIRAEMLRFCSFYFELVLHADHADVRVIPRRLRLNSAQNTSI